MGESEGVGLLLLEGEASWRAEGGGVCGSSLGVRGEWALVGGVEAAGGPAVVPWYVTKADRPT